MAARVGWLALCPLDGAKQLLTGSCAMPFCSFINSIISKSGSGRGRGGGSGSGGGGGNLSGEGGDSRGANQTILGRLCTGT